MTGYLPIIFICIGFAILAVCLIWHKLSKPLTVDQRVKRIKDKRTLPSGLQIWVEEGANVTLPETTAIEAGMQECFERAEQQGYQQPVFLTDYVVAILGDCMWRNGSWCYKIPMPDDYKGSPWDDGNGWLYVAGQYLSNRTDLNILVLPDYDGNHLDVLARTAGYEVEHCILRYCDPLKYERTRIHTLQTGHPLF